MNTGDACYSLDSEQVGGADFGVAMGRLKPGEIRRSGRLVALWPETITHDRRNPEATGPNACRLPYRFTQCRVA